MMHFSRSAGRTGSLARLATAAAAGGRRGLHGGAGPACGAVRFDAHGDPAQVCRWEAGDGGGQDVQLGLGKASVAWLRAPVNPSDINTVEGTYRGPHLPMPPSAVPGHEGVGRVVRVGPWRGPEGLHVGDLVVPYRPGEGTWRSLGVHDTAHLFRVPPELGETDGGLDFAATLTVNPMTALILLGEAIPGEVVLQTCANSAVGQAVVQIARAQGKRTFNIVRDRGSDEANAAVAEHLASLGADVVMTDKQILKARRSAIDQIVGLCAQGTASLALNGTGGVQATLAAHLLVKAQERVPARGPMKCPRLVTYGGMSREPVSLGAGLFIFSNLEAGGFWLSRWRENTPQDVWEAHVNSLLAMYRGGQLKPPLAAARVPLYDEDAAAGRLRDALALATQPPGAKPVGGKVFLDFAERPLAAAAA